METIFAGIGVLHPSITRVLYWAHAKMSHGGCGRHPRLTLTLGRLDNLNGATFVQTGMMPW